MRILSTKKSQFRVNGAITVVLLSPEHCSVIDTEDLPKVVEYNWYAAKNGRNVYAQAHINGSVVQMQRWLLVAPKGMLVDHKDCNTLNNRRENLRVVTRKQNNENKHGACSNSQSDIRGVCPIVADTKTYWCANVSSNGQKLRKYFPFTDEGCKQAEEWVIQTRRKVFTHSTN